LRTSEDDCGANAVANKHKRHDVKAWYDQAELLQGTSLAA